MYIIVCVCIETISSAEIATEFSGLVWYLKLLKNSFWSDAGHSTRSKVVCRQKKPLEKTTTTKMSQTIFGMTWNCALN